MSLVIAVNILVSLLVIGCPYSTASTCRSQLPSGVDSSICDEIESVIFTLRFAVKDIDKKVKETVVVALKEARKILDSTSETTITDIKEILSSRRTKRSLGEGLPSELRTLVQSVVGNIENAVEVAKKKIRSSIGLAVSSVDIQNAKIKTEATQLLGKILAKRSILQGNPVARRDLHSDIQKSLTAAADEVKTAMKEAVTTSIEEYKRIMDYFAPSLKELFKNANLDGNVDQAEQDIETLAITSSVGFIKFYDSFSKLAVGKAIRSVESLLSKVYTIGETNASALPLLKDLLERESRYISEVVVETTKEPDVEIRATIFEAAEKMFNDYKTIKGMIENQV